MKKVNKLVALMLVGTMILGISTALKQRILM